jgi:hypothetical protein
VRRVSAGLVLPESPGSRRNIIPDCLAYTASPEDIILAKMIFFREGGSDKHTRDIAGMLQVSGNEIDRAYISDWSERLDLEAIWKTICARVDQNKQQE